MDERTRIDVIDGVTGHTPDMLRFVNEPAVTVDVTATFPVGCNVSLRRPWPPPDPENRIIGVGPPVYQWNEYRVGLKASYFQDSMHE